MVLSVSCIEEVNINPVSASVCVPDSGDLCEKDGIYAGNTGDGYFWVPRTEPDTVHGPANEDSLDGSHSDSSRNASDLYGCCDKFIRLCGDGKYL